MNFEFKINCNKEGEEPVLFVFLHTKPYYEQNEEDDGVYEIAFKMPDDTSHLLEMMQQAINSTIELYFKENNLTLTEK